MQRKPLSDIFKRWRFEKKPYIPYPEKVWQDPIYFIAFGFGIGTIPLAPGTFATLAAIPLYLLFAKIPLHFYLLIVIVSSILSIIISDYVSKKIKVHDHPGMCLDEFIGFFVTMIAVPPKTIFILLGFILFRFFDILKPGPIAYLDQKVGGGFGMIIDDIAAGLFSCAILQIIIFSLDKIV